MPEQDAQTIAQQFLRGRLWKYVAFPVLKAMVISHSQSSVIICQHLW